MLNIFLNAEVGKGQCQVTARSFIAKRRILATFSHASARAEALPTFGSAMSLFKEKWTNKKGNHCSLSGDVKK